MAGVKKSTVGLSQRMSRLRRHFVFSISELLRNVCSYDTEIYLGHTRINGRKVVVVINNLYVQPVSLAVGVRLSF